MDRKKYSDLRKELNFSPCPSRLRNHLLQDLGLVAAIGCLLGFREFWACVISQILLACLYFRSFSMMHDAVHGSISKSRSLNDWLGVFYGGLCFLPFTTWRSMHLEHHAWAGNFDKDPVMRIVRKFPEKSNLHRKADSWLWRSWIPYIAFLQEVVFWIVSARFIGKKESYKNRRIELLASVTTPIVGMAGLVALGHCLGNWILLSPSIFLYLMMVEVINLPHHLRLPRISGESKLSLWNQYRVSRTCIYSSWFSRFVLLNFNYHAEHHMFPNLPWYELPKAYALVQRDRPEGYQLCLGHGWIKENRNKDLSEVFAPTAMLEVEAIPDSKAA